MARHTRRALSQYELAAQERVRERNAEQAGQISEPELPSTGTVRVSALLAEAQRRRDEAMQAEAQRRHDEARRRHDQALQAEAQRRRDEAQRQQAEAQHRRTQEQAETQQAETQHRRDQEQVEAQQAEARPRRDQEPVEARNDETLAAEPVWRGGGSRWSEIVLERRYAVVPNPVRPASADLDLPPAS